MMKQPVTTDRAPKAIGTYSQAIGVKHARMVYISGQIPLNPETGELAGPDMKAQIKQAFANLGTVAKEAVDRFMPDTFAHGTHFDRIAKLNVYLTDLRHFDLVNTHMQELFHEPYPARAVVQVAALPKGAGIEVDAVMHI